MTHISLGLSPCPNDTYIFEALLHARIPLPFTPLPHMADVEELNTLAGSGTLAVTKLSVGAVPALLDKYILLNSGAALGRGCGPLVVGRPGFPSNKHSAASIATPGPLSTAGLLLALTEKFDGQRVPMIFSDVIPAVAAGKTDLGVIIHEGRFTYMNKGLELVLDLGQWWEQYSGLPLPLGVIAVRRDLGAAFALEVEDAIRRSILHARAHPEDGLPFIREHAQEMDPAVMSSHIAMFVNDFSVDLGKEGQEAIIALLQAGAQENGITLPDLPVFAGVETP